MSYISAKVKDIVERALEDESSSDQATADLDQADKAQTTVRCPKCLKFVSQIMMKEGGICMHCWEKMEQEAKEETARQKVKAEAEEEVKEIPNEDLDLPF